MTNSPFIQNLGLLDYKIAWEKQRELQASLIAGSNREYFLFCEHSPTITYGSSTELSKVLLSTKYDIQSSGTVLIKTDRGGNITYHGPGQLVCYFIIDLRKRRQDVSWFLRSLEQGIIELLNSYDLKSFTIPSQTGVWISKKDKICSIGVRLSRWCTMHGLALNVSKASELGFDYIIPCGIAGVRATSIETILGSIPVRDEVVSRLSDIFLKIFYKDFGMDCI